MIFLCRVQSMKNGFSLVELSIVLVILGLLVGGILGGQSLIRSAELRAITKEYEKFTIATNTFRSKYFALPGDIKIATNFWGTATNCPGTTAQGTTDGSTCNGDGDGQIDGLPHTTSNEHYRVWQHLANAGLIEGVYNGVTGPDEAQWHSIPGTNVPKSKISSAGWDFYWQNNVSGHGYWFDGNYGHLLMVGGGDMWGTWKGILSPEEAWNIDTKSDDGMPGTGMLIVHDYTSCSTATLSTQVDSAYNLSSDAKDCALIFRNLF